MAILLVVAGAILGVLLDRIYTAIASRPKFGFNGGGGGGGGNPPSRYGYVTITNPEAFVGLRLRETVIFGRRIHGAISMGWTIERRTARGLMGVLTDPKTGHDIAGLTWFGPDGTSQQIDLRSGDSCNLCMFVGWDDIPDRYYIYSPQQDLTPTRPPAVQEFTSGDIDLKFSLVWANGQQRKSYNLKILRKHDGRHEWRIGGQTGVV
jgi:hypothetical protein